MTQYHHIIHHYLHTKKCNARLKKHLLNEKQMSLAHHLYKAHSKSKPTETHAPPHIFAWRVIASCIKLIWVLLFHILRAGVLGWHPPESSLESLLNTTSWTSNGETCEEDIPPEPPTFGDTVGLALLIWMISLAAIIVHAIVMAPVMGWSLVTTGDPISMPLSTCLAIATAATVVIWIGIYISIAFWNFFSDQLNDPSRAINLQ